MGARQVAWLGLAGALASGCILDDNHCSENQVEIKNLFEGCVCAPNAVPNADGYGCSLCGANEEAKGGACACIAGFSRPSPMAACMMTVDSGAPEGGAGDSGGSSGATGEGNSCTTSADCASFDATYCLTLRPPSTCLVQECATGVRHCSSSQDCCDFTGFALLESTHGLCVPKGMCNAPGKVVTP